MAPNSSMPAVNLSSREQTSLLFNIPTELRLIIYEHVFSEPSGSGLDTAKILIPLLTCRQFYHEALRIAFSSVTFHLNWYNIAEKYYDGVWYRSKNSPRVEIGSRIDGVLVENRTEPPATRNPMDFNIERIARRAGLGSIHLRSIRRIAVTSFLDLPKAGNWALWTMFHFLAGLESMKSRDLALDTLIIRTPFESDWPSTFESTTQSIRWQYSAILSALWKQGFTDKIVVDNTAIVTEVGCARAVSPQWFSAHHSHRMYCTGHDFMDKHAKDGTFVEAEERGSSLNLDDVQNRSGSEFVFYNYVNWPDQIDYIDITRRRVGVARPLKS